MVGNFVRSVYQRSSTATHVASGRDEANRREYVTSALMELLEVICELYDVADTHEKLYFESFWQPSARKGNPEARSEA